MSVHYMKTGELFVPEQQPTLTKQAFKDDADVNKILQKYQMTGTMSHLDRFERIYGDYSDYDFDEHQRKLAQGREIFDALPSEIRREFKNSLKEFFGFVNDPANVDRLPEVLPQIARPGDYFPDVSPSTPPDALKEPPAKEVPAAEPAAPSEGS